MNTNYKPIKNATGEILYYVNEYGNSVINTHGVEQRIFKSDDRKKVCLTLNGKPWIATTYRLVAMAFYNDGYSFDSSIDVHHIDCNRRNNHYSNLKPLSKAEHEKLHRMLNKHI